MLGASWGRLRAVLAGLEPDMILPISARNVQKKETSDDDDDNDEEEDEEEEKEEDSEQAVCLLPQKADDKIKSWVRNPLVALLSVKDLEALGWTVPAEVRPLTESGSVVQGQLRHRYEILIVAHSGFGNETLESTTRVPLAYPVDHEHAEAMCEDMLEVASMEHIDKRFVQQPKEAWRKEIRGGIMQAFVRAGALLPRYTM